MKLFRKIRHKLLSEHKFNKYLAYAIGEIILVVIGILIALAINNYQQKNILKQKEQTYLLGLLDEFEVSKSKLIELIKVNKRNYLGAKQILGYTSHDNKIPTEKHFSDLLLSSFSFDISYSSNNSILNEMINSGSLKDISNPQLRIQLTNWLSILEDVSQQENDLRDQRRKIFNMFNTDKYSIRTIFEQTKSDSNISFPVRENVVSNLGLLNSVEFENNILMFYLTSYATEKSHYDPLMENLNTILDLIKKEIK